MQRTIMGLLSFAVILPIATLPAVSLADSGIYVGGSAGGATLEANIGDTGISGFPTRLDEDDTAFKVFGGYTFDLPLLDLSVEAGYVDFGQPEINILGDEITLDTTGINLWGIAAIDVGLVDVFAKAGYISWDVDVSALGSSQTTDGSDLGYGLGLSFDLGPVDIRGEYEVYDLDGADLSMLSVGLLYRFD